MKQPRITAVLSYTSTALTLQSSCMPTVTIICAWNKHETDIELWWFTIDSSADRMYIFWYGETYYNALVVATAVQWNRWFVSCPKLTYISSLPLNTITSSRSSSCSSTASPSRAHTYLKLSTQLSNWSW